jgi:hypothetical protein
MHAAAAPTSVRPKPWMLLPLLHQQLLLLPSTTLRTLLHP